MKEYWSNYRCRQEVVPLFNALVWGEALNSGLRNFVKLHILTFWTVSELLESVTDRRTADRQTDRHSTSKCRTSLRCAANDASEPEVHFRWMFLQVWTATTKKLRTYRGQQESCQRRLTHKSTRTYLHLLHTSVKALLREYTVQLQALSGRHCINARCPPPGQVSAHAVKVCRRAEQVRSRRTLWRTSLTTRCEAALRHTYQSCSGRRDLSTSARTELQSVNTDTHTKCISAVEQAGTWKTESESPSKHALLHVLHDCTLSP